MAGGINQNTNLPQDEKMGSTDPYKSETVADWGALKAEWISTPISLLSLGEKYGVNYWSILYHYRVDKWREGMQEFNGLVKEKINAHLEQKAQDIADRVLGLDHAVLSTSEKIIKIVDEKIDEIREEKGMIDVKELEGFLKSIKVASEAIKNSHHNIRLSVGKSTEIVENTNINTTLSEEEEDRIANEFDFMSGGRHTKKRNISKE